MYTDTVQITGFGFREPVCPGLWHNTPLPFVKVFMNSEYAVLRVSPSKLEISSSSSNSQEM